MTDCDSIDSDDYTDPVIEEAMKVDTKTLSQLSSSEGRLAIHDAMRSDTRRHSKQRLEQFKSRSKARIIARKGARNSLYTRRGVNTHSFNLSGLSKRLSKPFIIFLLLIHLSFDDGGRIARPIETRDGVEVPVVGMLFCVVRLDMVVEQRVQAGWTLQCQNVPTCPRFPALLHYG